MYLAQFHFHLSILKWSGRSQLFYMGVVHGPSVKGILTIAPRQSSKIKIKKHREQTRCYGVTYFIKGMAMCLEQFHFHLSLSKRSGRSKVFDMGVVHGPGVKGILTITSRQSLKVKIEKHREQTRCYGLKYFIKGMTMCLAQFHFHLGESMRVETISYVLDIANQLCKSYH